MMEPLSIPLVTVASSAFTEAGTFDSKSWNGARPVPPASKK